mmetsp:Transcript_25275/g.49392  ORF Transcript_25275/g.49392 Transcript_25275/m.49392 type:complete len:90 (-) Transcript_25275:31-300(-)
MNESICQARPGQSLQCSIDQSPRKKKSLFPSFPSLKLCLSFSLPPAELARGIVLLSCTQALAISSLYGGGRIRAMRENEILREGREEKS